MVIQPEFTPRQKEALRLLTDHTNGINEVLYGGAAGGGKSFLGCSWIILSALQYPQTRYLIGRAVLKNLKDTTLNTFFDVCRKWGLEEGVAWNYNTKDNIIRFSPKYNGSSILLKDLFQYPSDPEFDSLGSLEITAAFIDEVSQITSKAKDIVLSRIRYRLDEYDLIPKILYATNPTRNWAKIQFNKPFSEGKLNSDRAFIPANVDDNKYVSKHYKDQLSKMPDGIRQRLLDGNWDYEDEGNSLMDYPAIIDIFSNKVRGGDKYITADIARLGRDKTVVGVWDGLILVRIETMPRNKTTEASELIKRLRVEHRVPWTNIAIDADGVGGGVVDELDNTEIISIVNGGSPIHLSGEKENFGNLKSQLYYYLAEAINHREVQVRCSPDQREHITRELEVVKRKDVDKDGRYYILPKDQVKDLIGRSPDYSDMMAYRMYFELTNQSRFL